MIVISILRVIALAPVVRLPAIESHQSKFARTQGDVRTGGKLRFRFSKAAGRSADSQDFPNETGEYSSQETGQYAK